MDRHFDMSVMDQAGDLNSDLNDQGLFHSIIDAPPGVPGLSKKTDDQTEIHSGELERFIFKTG